MDSLLVIGVLTNLVKGGDLLLRKRQKKWLQERFEVLTLRLDDIRPVSWFGALSRPRPAAVWSAFSALFVFVAPISALGGALAFLLDLWIMSAQNILAVNAPPGLALGVGLLVAVPVSALVLWKLCPGLVRTLVGTGHGAGSLGASSFCISQVRPLLVPSTVRQCLPRTLPLPGMSWRSCGRFCFPAFVLNASGLLLVTLLFFLWIFRLLFSAAKAVCWRIAEYDCGVFAALLLIVTAGLGLYRVLLTGG